MTASFPLDALFFQLVRDGFPLAVRDLQQALAALEAGFGIGSRRELMRLCQHLWARSDEEQRRIEFFFRHELPVPTAREIAALTGQPPSGEDAARAAVDRHTAMPSFRRQAETMEIVGPGEASGIALPRAVLTLPRDESFILTPKPLVPFRSCVIAWRRYRRALRDGPKVDVDLEQTVAAKAQRGFLPAPVMAARRRNQARLVVLVDRGAAMAAWALSSTTLVDSLRESRLAGFGVFYFDAAPDRLFERPALTGPLALDNALDRFRDVPAVVVSEAGSARGGFDQPRIGATRQLVERIAGAWRPLAWLNPMPPRRWRGTSASVIAGLPGLTMVPFTTEGLIQAIDVLRGQRQP